MEYIHTTFKTYMCIANKLNHKLNLRNQLNKKEVVKLAKKKHI